MQQKFISVITMKSENTVDAQPANIRYAYLRGPPNTNLPYLSTHLFEHPTSIY